MRDTVRGDGNFAATSPVCGARGRVCELGRVRGSGTGESAEVEIPLANPLAQWLTADSDGNVWIIEPGSAALGVISERVG